MQRGKNARRNGAFQFYFEALIGAIPERLRGVFTTMRMQNANPRLPYLTFVLFSILTVLTVAYSKPWQLGRFRYHFIEVYCVVFHLINFTTPVYIVHTGWAKNLNIFNGLQFV